MKLASLGLAIGACLATAPALAHHSFAMFDNTKVVILRGTLVSFTNLNPHVWISLTATPDHATTAPRRWDVEATAPITLAMMGIHPETMKPGDKLTIAIRPLRDGRQGGSLVFVVTADGLAHGANPADLGLDPAKLKPS